MLLILWHPTIIIRTRWFFEIEDEFLHPVNIGLRIPTRTRQLFDVSIHLLIGSHQFQQADNAKQCEITVMGAIRIQQLEEGKDDFVSWLKAGVPIFADTVCRTVCKILVCIILSDCGENGHSEQSLNPASRQSIVDGEQSIHDLHIIFVTWT